MTADGELYIDEECRDVFEKELDEWYGKDNWRLNGNNFSDCWDMRLFPEKVEVEVLSETEEDKNGERKIIGKVEITNEFFVVGDDYGRDVGIQPKAIKKIN